MTSSYRISFLFLLLAFSMSVTAQVITPAPSAFGGVDIDDLFLQRRQQTACDGKAGIFKCPTGTCYTGSNGYVGCCTVESCAPRTTCVPYKSGNLPQCDVDTDGCTVCTDSKLAFCVTESNYVNSQHIIYCNSFATFISWSYTNTITQLDSKTTKSSSSRSSASSSGSTATKAGASTGGTATVTATATATPSPAPKSNLNTGAFVGIGIGGFAIVSILVALLFWFCWRPRKGKYINHNVADGRSSLPAAPYAPIALEATKYQPNYTNSRAEMASPPLTGNAALRQYGYPGTGRQSPTPGPEAYLLPVQQEYHYQPYNPASTSPTAAYSQPQTPTTHHLPPTSPTISNDNRVSSLSELVDTSSYRMSSTPGPNESTMTLSATGAGGYVSPEDALRTGRTG